MSKTALVTGAASGLGLELSLLLAKDNYNLVLIDIDATNLENAKSEILKINDIEIISIVKNLCDPGVSEVIFNEIKGMPIDVLVNNAGFGLFGKFADTEWRREMDMLQLHVITSTHLTKLVLTGMLERNSGKILNVSSLAGFQPGPLMSIYYASKAYMLSFSQAISNELKGTGVTATVLCPGPTKTSFQEVVSGECSKNKITFNMACADKVAAYGYKAMIKGKEVAVPGIFNKFLSGLPRLLTRKRATSVVRKIQEKNREIPNVNQPVKA
ncbi:short-chain dehydrogenase [Flavivirga aquatica]|uniref:Short-chain dehydrogenase n=1 Tax=Flavivirga aquatica TaxID=1849968 RepID=A0A1E5SIP7_9FLAO|nr:SDR family oxidoreductase [Flavivirga aquatica]OEJ98999.1 short-chain dehydrogenase [Flavivirga aquatica]